MSTIMSSIGREGGDSETSDKTNVEEESSKSKGVFSRFRSKEPSTEEMKQPKKKEEGNVFSGMWDSVFNKDDNSGENWVVVCPKTRISPGEVVPVVASGLDLLIVASRDGKRVSCLANSCPHLGMPLETGRLERRPMEGFFDGVPSEDGKEDCIVCPLHETAFALETGEVRGEWCPHPPIIGKMMGAVKPKTNAATFQIRVRGKNIEVRINSSLDEQNAATKKER
jgi:nitrite reductase/ring-hydroxylating ferredoxin subunit